jgi:hypothetical protein
MKATISKDYFNTAHDFEVTYNIEDEPNGNRSAIIDKVTYNNHDVTLAFIDEVQLLVNETPECLEEYSKPNPQLNEVFGYLNDIFGIKKDLNDLTIINPKN